MCKTNKLSLTIVALTLGILMLVANNLFASITFSQLSEYDKKIHYTAPKEYPQNPAMETTGAIRVGTNNVPIMKVVLEGEKGGTTLETLTVFYTGTRISDIGKYIEIYEGSTLLSERSFVGSKTTLWVSRTAEEGATRTYIIVLDIAPGAESYEVDLRVEAVNEYPNPETNSFIKDGEKIPDEEDYGNIGTVNTPDPDGSGLIDAPPITASISSGKTVISGSSGNEIIFECTAVESMKKSGGAISFTVPTDWTRPQGTKGQEGYTHVESDGDIGSPTYKNRTMEVPTKSLSKGQHIWIYYGYGGGSSGVVAPVPTREYGFMIKAKPSEPSGGEFMELTNDLLKGNLLVRVIKVNSNITQPHLLFTESIGNSVTIEFTVTGTMDGGGIRVGIPEQIGVPATDSVKADTQGNAQID